MDGILHRLAGAAFPRSFDPMALLARRNAEHRMRRRMWEMEDWQLRDIGLTRADIEATLRRR